MAFKDGMGAIAKVLKSIAVGMGGFLLLAGLYSLIDSSSRTDSAGFFILCAAFVFVVFWTPAWIIKKFIE